MTTQAQREEATREVEAEAARRALEPGEELDWDHTVGGASVWIAVRKNAAGAVVGTRILAGRS